MQSTWILVALAIVVGLVALSAFITYWVRRVLARGSIPMNVLIDERVTISMPDPVCIPLDAQLRVSFREQVRVEADIPISMDLPLDTVVETSVLGLGTIKIPIKAKIPLSLTIPISVPVTVDATNVPIHLRQDIDIRLPEFVLPLKTSLRVGIPVKQR